MRAAAVRVPCSTSNLGAGFDCIGLALQRFLEVRYLPGDASLRVEHGGTLRAVVSKGSRGPDVLERAFRAGLAARGIARVTGRIDATSDVPIARGLGSSGAAAVAGLTLAAAATGAALDRDAELARALEIEGHPDNAAPSLYGGLVAVARGNEGGAPRAIALPLADSLAFAFAAPDAEVSTAHARTALPASVPHLVAARGLGRVAALIAGFEHADPELLAIGFDDELHVPHRLPLIPHAPAAIEAGRAAGAFAVTISGSGSGLIAVAPRPLAASVAHAMGEAFGGGIAFDVEAERRGIVSLAG